MKTLENRLRSLKARHAKLDEDIKKMESSKSDGMIIRSAKKDKLRVKEEITKIELDDRHSR